MQHPGGIPDSRGAWEGGLALAPTTHALRFKPTPNPLHFRACFPRKSAVPSLFMKPKFTFDALAAAILRKPDSTPVELGRIFGYSGDWISLILSAGAFQELLANKKAESKKIPNLV